ncbi:argininosuccinate synthase [Candidatus Vidania fulgoroideorum]
MIIKSISKLKKKQVAISYSGGLDTSVALKWMNEKNLKVYVYHANIENLSKKKVNRIKKKAHYFGAFKFKSINLNKKIVDEAIKVVKYNAFSVISGLEKYYNTTPIGRIVITKGIIKEMKKDNVNIWSDGSTYKGNDIERFFTYSISFNKNIKIYKPWLDKKFIKEIGGGRKEMLSYLKKDKNKKYFKYKKYSIDSNLLGNTYEGSNIENLDFFPKGKKILKYYKKGNNNNKVYIIEYKKGIPYAFNNKTIKNRVDFFYNINKIAGNYKIGFSDQIENRIIGTKSRGIYEAPAMELLHIIYERIANCVHNEESLSIYRENSYKLGRMLYLGKWLSFEACMIKNMLEFFSKRINGKITFKLKKNKVNIIKTNVKNSLYNIENSSMEKNKKEKFSYKDRIGYLNILKLSL